MTTPAGQLKFSDIQTEFGPNVGSQHNLGQYRVNQTVGDRTWRLDNNVPIPGQQISFSDLLGKTLNCVVDYPNEETRVSSGTKFDNSATVIGGFKSIPSRSNNTQTKKVYHLIRNILGATDQNTAVALRTGSWDTSTLLLKYIVNSNGRIWGRGGAGGGQNGGTGENGSPALGVEYSCELSVESGGQVRGGGGGGGGGGSYAFDQNVPIGNFTCSANGGSGGTGAGYNNQDGADGGNGPSNFCRASGNNCNPGGGGGGGAGYGGNGGDWGTTGNNGCPALTSGVIGNEQEYFGNFGSGGTAGAAIIRTSSGLTVTVTNNGTISGDQTAVGSFT